MCAKNNNIYIAVSSHTAQYG